MRDVWTEAGWETLSRSVVPSWPGTYLWQLWEDGAERWSSREPLVGYVVTVRWRPGLRGGRTSICVDPFTTAGAVQDDCVGWFIEHPDGECDDGGDTHASVDEALKDKGWPIPDGIAP